MNYFEKRRMRKGYRELLNQARHVRSMREDLATRNDLEELLQVEHSLAAAVGGNRFSEAESHADRLHLGLARLWPARSFPALRENIEILVVAVVVAMAFRTYLIQPFKIPTGSMQPTLYGIHSEPRTGPSLTDRMPLKLLKWAVTGEWYREIKVRIPGQLTGAVAPADTDDPSIVYYYIAGIRYKVPRDAQLNCRPGQYIPADTVIWKGIVTTGDHVFVDKVRWNFTRPKRDQVIVFSTDNIQGIAPDTHYIKRLVGLPGETMSIQPPDVLAEGQPLRAWPGIARIASKSPGYGGYRLPAPWENDAILKQSSDSIQLSDTEYFALGDNTGNSRDGRYWGPVPQKNAVGPALIVYWPLSKRWGLIR